MFTSDYFSKEDLSYFNAFSLEVFMFSSKVHRLLMNGDLSRKFFIEKTIA
jgi:hypothetical protein